MSIKKLINRVLVKSTYYRNIHTMGRKALNYNNVNLEYWNYSLNLGDYLSPIIVNWMLDQKNIIPEKRIKRTKHLYAVGSVIGMGRFFDATIWGAGIHTVSAAEKIINEKNYRKYDIRSVRGPETATILKKAGYSCPDIYGDPAVLMPLIYPKTICKKEYDISIIHHYLKKQNSLEDNLHEINIMTDNYKGFIDELCNSKLVISSSLHGIIIAESYGIPAIFLNEGLDNEIMKFNDWYYSTGRYEIRYAKSVEEAKNMLPMELPDLSYMQKQLLETFPYDLWE